MATTFASRLVLFAVVQLRLLVNAELPMHSAGERKFSAIQMRRLKKLGITKARFPRCYSLAQLRL